MSIFTLSDTARLNTEVAQAIGKEVIRRNSRIAYVSASPQVGSRTWFCNTSDEYKRLSSAIQLTYFDLSRPFSAEEEKKILQFGTIHLSGGNTFEFLEQIRGRGFDRILKLHLSDGGLVVGVSAGAIVLTPSTATASLCGDAQREKSEFRGLNFVPYEFYPHFDLDSKALEKLSAYSRTTPNTILGCTDTDGVFFEDEHIYTFGCVRKVRAGQVDI